MLIDTHVHVGQFNNLYISPKNISKLMSDVGVDYYAISSTTICEENYTKVLDEIHELINIDEDKVLPIMWITPEGLKGNIAWFLESDIKWKCIKVHPFLHPNDWDPKGTQFNEVIDITKELKVPILIHTGNEDCCKCSKYDSLIYENKDVTFILAHGRPLDEAIGILHKHNNVYVDSAFMSVDDMVAIANHGYSSRLLWGTDMYIPKYFFPEKNMIDVYKDKYLSFHCKTRQIDFDNVTWNNAKYLFSL